MHGTPADRNIGGEGERGRWVELEHATYPV